jgi:hypothetical protein
MNSGNLLKTIRYNEIRYNELFVYNESHLVAACKSIILSMVIRAFKLPRCGSLTHGRLSELDRQWLQYEATSGWYSRARAYPMSLYETMAARSCMYRAERLRYENGQVPSRLNIRRHRCLQQVNCATGSNTRTPRPSSQWCPGLQLVAAVDSAPLNRFQAEGSLSAVHR